MQRFVLYLIGVLFLIFPNGVFADALSDIHRIMANKKMVVSLTAQDYPPYFYENDRHELDGFDIAYAKDIAKNLGVKAEFIRSAKSFNDVVQQVEQGTSDLGMGALSATAQRGISVHFSNPYLTVKKVLIVNRLLSLKKKEPLLFGVAKDSSYETSFYEKFVSLNHFSPSSKLVSYDDMDKAFKDVIAGKIYAFYTDEAYADFLFEKNKKAHLYIKKEILQKQFDSIAIATSWKNPMFVSWLNLYIQTTKADGTEDFFAKKYLKEM